MTHQELLRYFHANYLGLVKDMRNSYHEFSNNNLNPYHLEGSVFEHTMLVFHEAVKRGYDYETQLACLFHDLGKPMVRAVDTVKNKVTFYNHESASVFLALQIMDDLKLPDAVRERLVKVIGLHTEVFKKPLNELYELVGDRSTFELLMRLAQCDHSGRFFDGDVTPIDYTLFNGVDNERPEKLATKKVTLLVGLPASGKSTEIACKKDFDDAYLISRDEIIELYNGKDYNEKWKNADQDHVDKELQKQFKASKEFNNVVVDMTHLTLKSRRRTLSQFGKDWQKDCIVLLPTPKTIMERIWNRKGKIISDEVYQRMVLSFRPPLLGEGFDNITYKF